MIKNVHNKCCWVCARTRILVWNLWNIKCFRYIGQIPENTIWLIFCYSLREKWKHKFFFAKTGTHCTFIDPIDKIETIQFYNNSWIDEQILTSPFNGILLNIKKELLIIKNSMYESQNTMLRGKYRKRSANVWFHLLRF